MRKLTGITRRLFGQSLGAAVALTIIPKSSIAQTETAEVIIRKFTFEPKTLTVKRGSSVRWINIDSAPHTATSTDDSWDTAELEKQQSSEIVFQKTGNFQYFCAYHPHMKGKIIVID